MNLTDCQMGLGSLFCHFYASGVCFFSPVIHGGPLEKQEPSGAGVGGPVLLPSGAQCLWCGTRREEL